MPTTEDVPEARKVKGKVNYFDWRRNFDQAPNKKDLWKLISGSEKVLQEPGH